jgi:hypothetical protein
MKKRDMHVQIWDNKWYLEKFDMHECCDCGLVHDVEYKVENGRIFTRWKRNDTATKKVRKSLNAKRP